MNTIKLLTFSGLILIFTTASAQNTTLEGYEPFKKGFKSGCLEKQIDVNTFNQIFFCDCAYEKLFEQMDSTEINNFIALASKSKKKLEEAFLEIPEVKEKIEDCAMESITRENEDDSLALTDMEVLQWALIEDVYKTECRTSIKKNKKLNKTINSEEFCSCSFNKIKEQIPMKELEKGGKKVEDEISKIAIECMIEITK